MISQTFVKRIVAWRERPPKSFFKSVVLNTLGFQIPRVLWLNIWRRLGWVQIGTDIHDYAKKLKDEGIVLIPEFLPQDVFAEIRAEYEKETRGIEMRPLASPYIVAKTDNTRIQFGHFIPEPHTRLYELLDKHFTKNDMLTRLGSTVVHERIRSYRPPQIFVNKKDRDEYPDLNSDIYFHCDVPFPGVKAFLYLSDIGADNGAFTYAKGTHKLTWKRWKWEYRKSIEWARNATSQREPGDETGRAWHCLTREEEAREGIIGTPMMGPANSVVMFNVMGFHRRGDFTSDRPREFAVAYYRS